MPLVKRWHVPRGLRPTLTGRKVRTTLMSRVERQQRGNVAPRPLWFDAALAHPPPPKFQLDRPPDLAFPEDELRREWLRRNPAATMVPKALFLEEASVPNELRRHPGDAFVERQMELIEEGTAPEEAYRIVAAEQEREGDVRALEERTARGVAAALGAALDAQDAEPRKHRSLHSNPRTLARTVSARSAEDTARGREFAP